MAVSRLTSHPVTVISDALGRRFDARRADRFDFHRPGFARTKPLEVDQPNMSVDKRHAGQPDISFHKKMASQPNMSVDTEEVMQHNSSNRLMTQGEAMGSQT